MSKSKIVLARFFESLSYKQFNPNCLDVLLIPSLFVAITVYGIYGKMFSIKENAKLYAPAAQKTIFPFIENHHQSTFWPIIYSF